MTRLTLKAEPPLRLSVDALIPERIGGLSPAEIERLPLALGNRQSRVGDWFAVTAGSDAGHVEIEGPCRRLDRIGAAMTAGSLRISGDAGAYAGLGMHGGSLEIEGAAGYGAATDMRGGLLRIRGNAGDGLGGPLPGARGGMRDGTVIVSGDAGAGAGARLRRGLIVIAGAVGPSCGAAMAAGTLVVGGRFAGDAGAAMQRGSIIALSAAPQLGPGFGDNGVHDLVFLRLVARELAALGLGALSQRLGPVRRFVGDAGIAGRGEVMVVG